MRSFQLHTPSLALGLAACAVVFMSMSQVAPQLGPPRVEYGPNPRDMVQIEESTPYAVPAGTMFVLTALGHRDLDQIPTRFIVDGVVKVQTIVTASSPTNMIPVAVGMTVPAGSVITVADGDTSDAEARAWGYLSR